MKISQSGNAVYYEQRQDFYGLKTIYVSKGLLMNKNIYGYGNPYNPEALRALDKIKEEIKEELVTEVEEPEEETAVQENIVEEVKLYGKKVSTT